MGRILGDVNWFELVQIGGPEIADSFWAREIEMVFFKMVSFHIFSKFKNYIPFHVY
jgi:hypothetical protein